MSVLTKTHVPPVQIRTIIDACMVTCRADGHPLTLLQRAAMEEALYRIATGKSTEGVDVSQCHIDWTPRIISTDKSSGSDVSHRSDNLGNVSEEDDLDGIEDVADVAEMSWLDEMHDYYANDRTDFPGEY